MSDHRNAAEIEDVLSSIRRLVSEELRPETRPARGGRRKAAAPPEKLILTPALRVDVVVPAVAVVEAPLEPFIAMEVDRVADGVVVDISTRKRRKTSLQAPKETDVSTEADPAGAEAVAAVLTGIPKPEPQIIEVEEAEIVADEPAALALPGPAVAAQGDVIVADEADFVDADLAAMPVSEAMPMVAEDDEFSVAEGLEVLQSSDERTFIPGFRSHRTAMGAEAAGGQEFETLDEDALRDLVRDVIREEFQGMLGERITRNVRKLVRTEINRALVAKGLT